MRSGRLLAEDSPDKLLAYYNLSSLEDVFLRLCMKQGANAVVGQLEIVANVIPSNETPQIVTLAQQQSEEHDNMGFDYSVNEDNASENDVDLRNRKNSHESPANRVPTPTVRAS